MHDMTRMSSTLEDMDPMLELAFAIKRARREIDRRFAAALRPLGITVVQAEAVVLLAEGQPLSVGELGDRLCSEAGSPSRLVDRMVAAGLVERRVADHDRRQAAIALTDRGEALARRVVEVREPVLDEVRARLDPAAVPGATALLQSLLEVVSR